MRILLLSDEPHDPSMGGPKVALKLQSGLIRLGHACDVLFRPDLGVSPRSPRLRLALAPWLARRALAVRSGYDVVDAASAEGHLIPRLSGRVVIARSHGLEHLYYRELIADAHAGLLRKPLSHRLWYPLARLTQVRAALRRADGVIMLSQRDRQFVIDRGWQPARRVEVIPHGMDAERWQLAPAPDSPRGAGLLFCGWWTTSKGTAYLARAHALLLALGIAAPLTLLGVGVADTAPGLAALQTRIRSAFAPASQPLLRILPRTLDEDAVFAEYRRHDILVCSSTSEGFGMVIIEALSQRLPVVCCRGVGAADLLCDGAEALLVPSRDPEALAAAIARLWRDPDLRRQMGERGHQRTEELNWTAAAARTAACYRAAQARSSTPASGAASTSAPGIPNARSSPSPSARRG